LLPEFSGIFISSTFIDDFTKLVFSGCYRYYWANIWTLMVIFFHMPVGTQAMVEFFIGVSLYWHLLVIVCIIWLIFNLLKE
jgi:hypothetical protein